VKWLKVQIGVARKAQEPDQIPLSSTGGRHQPRVRPQRVSSNAAGLDPKNKEPVPFGEREKCV
jgi:hypothetical protein